eukprot:scaffold322_cov109-Isochrysis_galbana.AAC.8
MGTRPIGLTFIESHRIAMVPPLVGSVLVAGGWTDGPLSLLVSFGWCADVCLPGWRHDGDVGSPHVPMMLFVATKGGPSPGKPRVDPEFCLQELVRFCFCKALAGSGLCASGRTGGRVVLVLRPCWGCKCGSLAHHVALHWAARVCGWQWHGHAHCGRRRGL